MTWIVAYAGYKVVVWIDDIGDGVSRILKNGIARIECIMDEIGEAAVDIAAEWSWVAVQLGRAAVPLLLTQQKSWKPGNISRK